MKAFVVFLLLFSLTGCYKSPVDPPEIKATILGYEVGFVACSGGCRLQTETDEVFLAHDWTLPAPYNDYTKVSLPASVWIRYKEPSGSCRQFPDLIDIISIRIR